MSIFAFCLSVNVLTSISDIFISGYSVQAALYRASLRRLPPCITASAHFAMIMAAVDNATIVSSISIVVSFRVVQVRRGCGRKPRISLRQHAVMATCGLSQCRICNLRQDLQLRKAPIGTDIRLSHGSVSCFLQQWPSAACHSRIPLL